MMKFRFLFALVLISALSGMAKADPLDFKARVQDPADPILGTTDLTSGDPFSFTFGGCPVSVTSTDSAATSCFLAINDTGSTITSLDISFDNTTDPSDPTDYVNYLNGQPASCDTASADGSLFGAASCALSGSTYALDFSGGTGITNGTFFILVIDGPVPSAFGPADGTMTLASTPEPGSIVLFSTGIAALGFVVIRRRQAAGLSLNWKA